MKYLNPYVVHGLTPPNIPGYESQLIPEPMVDNTEEIRQKLIAPMAEESCPACDLGGCMVKGCSYEKSNGH